MKQREEERGGGEKGQGSGGRKQGEGKAESRVYLFMTFRV